VLEASDLPPDTEAPSAPTGLSASSIGDTQLTLTWTASTDNVAVAGYRIVRDGAQVHATASTSYPDTGLAPLTAYTYRVAAYDFANNESALSAPFTVTTTAPAPSFVQQGSAVPQSPQSVVSAAYPVAQTAGDTNIVAIGWNDTSAVIASVVDSAGNTYQVAAPTVRGNGLSQAVYYAPDIASAGANQVTVTFDRAAVFVDLRVTEYAGLRHGAPFHTTVSATGTGGSATTPALTTTAASELLFAAGMTSGSFTGAGAGYTSRVITAPDGDLIEDGIAAAVGSYTATAPFSGGTWLLQLAAFAP
jgi:chitodextrinase